MHPDGNIRRSTKSHEKHAGGKRKSERARRDARALHETDNLCIMRAVLLVYDMVADSEKFDQEYRVLGLV